MLETRVTVEDKGAKDIFRVMRELDDLDLTIGFQGDDGREQYPRTRVSVAQVALFNEFGTIDMPARGFLRSTMREQGDTIAQLFADNLKPVFELKRKPIPALELVGAGIVRLVKKKILTSRAWAAPNALSTLQRKGFNKPPLIDTSKMIAALSWAVRRKTGIGAGLILSMGK